MSRTVMIAAVVIAAALAVGSVLVRDDASPTTGDLDAALLQRRLPADLVDLSELRSLTTLQRESLVSSRVVPLPCIESRSDPVGVFMTVEVVGAEVRRDVAAITIRPTDIRLGSHPSGCREPEVLAEESWFVLDGDTTIEATAKSVSGDETTVFFDLSVVEAPEVAAVLLPRIGYLDGSDMRRTSAYGPIEAFRLEIG